MIFDGIANLKLEMLRSLENVYCQLKADRGLAILGWRYLRFCRGLDGRILVGLVFVLFGLRELFWDGHFCRRLCIGVFVVEMVVYFKWVLFGWI